MGKVKLFAQCLFSPRLFKVYPETHIEGFYDAGNLERFGDQIISSLHLLWNVGVFISPILAGVMYKKGFFVMDGMISFAKFATGVGIIIATSYIIRGIGRMNDPNYQKFLKALKNAEKDLNKDTKRELMKYDFEFSYWPVSFKWTDVEGEEKKNRRYIKHPSTRHSAIERVFGLPCDVASYLVAHTFGLRMIYPGSIYLLQYLMYGEKVLMENAFGVQELVDRCKQWIRILRIGKTVTNTMHELLLCTHAPLLLTGRIKLVNENRGERFKLQTRDGNFIDTMFVNRRGDRNYNKGDILVICCEGNAGFYEIGIMVTPLEAGHSVLGWNRPGFAGSTGMPYPLQETNAMDIVMQFAIHELKFVPENIVLFGWSIGGYSAAWAAMNYPDVRGVIMDATFDDIVALAVTKMPRYLEGIVKRTIRDHVNLNVYEHIVKYPGPVQLVRRTDDEVLCTDDFNKLTTNRGNNLLVKFLRYRYPNIIDHAGYVILSEWLSTDNSHRAIVRDKYQVDEEFCSGIIHSYVNEHSNSFPMLIGEGLDEQSRAQLTIFLALKHMTDYRSSHCTPLPVRLLKMPWDGTGDGGFVKL